MGLISHATHLPGAVWSTAKAAGKTAKELVRSGSITQAVDTMIDIPNESIHKRVNDLRIKHPHATPAELSRIVSRDFRRVAATTSGLVGASAAMPGVGTVAGVGLSSAQLLGFVTQAGYYVLTMASIHGIPTDDYDKRRLLVLTSLLGEQGAEIASSQFGFSTLTALKGYASDMQRQTIRRVNKALAKRASKQAATRGLSATFGRVMPFGIGAAVGWVVGRSMAGSVIEGVEHALGPAPEEFAFPVEVDIEVSEALTPSAREDGESVAATAASGTATQSASNHNGTDAAR